MNAHNRVTDDNEIAVCPECDTGGIGLASPGGMQFDEPAGKRYWCPKCGAKFDEFVSRERKSDTALYGLARRLADADPDEVSR
jgi:hypothetical protein